MDFSKQTAAVIGCGVIGVCTAWSLLKQGIKHVTLIDESCIPRPQGGASIDGGRAIRYPYGSEEGYTLMVSDAYDAWSELWEDLGKVHYTETGMLFVQLCASENSVKTFRDTYGMDSYKTIKKLKSQIGEQVKFLGKEQIQDLHPFLRCDDLEFGLYSPKAGVLHAADIVVNTFKWVSKHPNATTLCGPEYECIKFETNSNENSTKNSNDPNSKENHCVLKNGKVISTDIMIFAMNCFTSKLFPEVKDTLTPSRQELVYFMPPDDEIKQWKSAPMLLEKSGEDSYYYLPYVGGTGTYGIKASTHSMDVTGYDFFTESFEPKLDFNDSITKWVQNRFSNRGDKPPLQPCFTRVCYYDVSPEERFQMYFLNSTKTAMSLYGFSGHGFKFGALVGKAVSLAATKQKSPETVQKWLAGQLTARLDTFE
ncbi:MAG: FAD-binding oxidoreductase [Rickettsia sp.]|nr:FAD-binding oxidoreductase [Rickettsia sp.]